MAEALHNPLALFMMQAAVVIIGARLAGLVMRRIGQPMVIAEIVAGIVLGPSVLGWLAPGVEAAIFPKSSMPLLATTSQIGLIFFMFLIGLELDPKLLKGRTHTSVVISHTSILVPFGLGALLAFYLYPRVSSPDVRFTSFFLFLGAAMSVTAFPVLARILVERRLLRSRIGAIVIACAAVDDVTAWCILAFVVSIVRASGVMSAVRTTIFAVVYIAVMFGLVRPFARRFADRTKSGVSQNIVAVTLLLVLASSWATELIGIHALFGAFVFGAIVPKEGTFARHLAEKIEDLVVVFLLPLFFAFSGLRTQLGLLDTPHAWLMCALVVVTACVGKFGGAGVAARLTGLGWRESSAIGILMNTRGLVELIVLNLGYDLGVISPTMFTMLVIMALVTTFMTTPILQWVYPIDELAKELAEPEAPKAALRPFTVLGCVAFERSGPGLVTLGAAISGKNADRGRLYALRLVAPSPSGIAMPAMDEGDHGEDKALVAAIARGKELEVDVRPISFVSARPGRDICDVADVKQAQVVLLGLHKPILGRTLLGGTVHEVMSQTPATVGVLVDRGLKALKSILVPYLGSEHDRAALALARRIAENTHARVTILHVVRSDKRIDVRDKVDEIFKDPGEGGVEVEVQMKLVQHDTPYEAVLAESSGHDLVLIGVGREWGLEHRFFGLQSEAVLMRSTASVLVVRGGAVVPQSQVARAPAEVDELRKRLITKPPLETA